MKGRRRNLLPLAAALVLAGTAGLGALAGYVTGTGADATQAAANARPPADAFDHHFRRGVELLLARRFAESAEILELARAIRPHVPEVHANLGFAYLELGRSAAATAAFGKALDLNRDQVNAYYGLAEALDAAGDRAGALGAMRAFLHRAGAEDPFRRRAMAALWEWEAKDGAAGATAAAAPPAEQGWAP